MDECLNCKNPFEDAGCYCHTCYMVLQQRIKELEEVVNAAVEWANGNYCEHGEEYLNMQSHAEQGCECCKNKVALLDAVEALQGGCDEVD